MKQLILTLLANLFIFSTVLAANLQKNYAETGNKPFITVWKTDNPGISNDNQITIPGEGNDYIIEWEEMDNPENSGNESGSGEHTITFPAPGTYRVNISGDFHRISFKGEDFHDYGDAKKILSIEQWGDIAWTSMESAFFRAVNLNITAEDAPDLSKVTSLAEMFSYASTMNSDIGHWNTENVEDMSGMFHVAQSFNQDISGWNTENVKNMSKMFRLAFSFNQDIGNWDTGSVEDMSWMFSNYYESPTGGIPCRIDEPFDWVVYDIYTSFDQNISGWNTENVQDMSGMFYCAATFNQDIGDWDTGNVRDMSGMFYNTRSFNQNIGNWNTGNVEDMSYMFNHAFRFNQDIGNWDTGRVRDMSRMFAASEYYLVFFNQDIGNWDTGSAEDMSRMFMFNPVFNQDIGGWNVENVTDMIGMLSFSGLSIANYDSTLIGWAKQSLQSNVTLGASGLKFHAAKDARELIKNNFGWSFINDSYSVDSSVEPRDTSPDQFAIQQNSPNPFNPSTRIRYSLPESAHVTVEVFDITGRHVATLVDRQMPPGEHATEFEAAGLSSGIYVYRIQAGDFVQTRSMMLVK